MQFGSLAARDRCTIFPARGCVDERPSRSMSDGIVLDLSAMREVVVNPDRRSARVSGGARALDLLATTDPLGLAAVTGSCSAVGMAGLTLGGGLWTAHRPVRPCARQSPLGRRRAGGWALRYRRTLPRRR